MESPDREYLNTEVSIVWICIAIFTHFHDGLCSWCQWQTESMNKFRLSKKKRIKRNKDGLPTSTLSLDLPSVYDQSEPRELDKLRFSWVRSESLDYGIFCGQSASWESTIYFKNGGSDDIYEYSIKWGGGGEGSPCDCHVMDSSKNCLWECHVTVMWSSLMW